jgi:hypothetical protein
LIIYFHVIANNLTCLLLPVGKCGLSFQWAELCSFIILKCSNRLDHHKQKPLCPEQSGFQGGEEEESYSAGSENIMKSCKRNAKSRLHTLPLEFNVSMYLFLISGR